MYFQPSPKSTPNACCGKNGVIGFWIICNYCNDAKDEAFARGQGLDWIPDNCSECGHVRRILEQTVTYREWQEPLMYADDEPHTMWAWNPLSNPKHCF